MPCHLRQMSKCISLLYRVHWVPLFPRFIIIILVVGLPKISGAGMICDTIGQEKIDTGITLEMREGLIERIECLQREINKQIDVLFTKQPEESDALKKQLKEIQEQHLSVMWSVHNANDGCPENCGTIHQIMPHADTIELQEQILIDLAEKVSELSYDGSIKDHGKVKEASELKQVLDYHVILPLICPEDHIIGNKCDTIKPLKGAPKRENGEPCDLVLNDWYEGNFVSTQSNLLIIGYSSSCEPHANNWGGSILFIQDTPNGAYKFDHYERGMVLQYCLTLKETGRRDRLLCEIGAMGQGVVVSTISEYLFEKDYSEDVNVYSDVIVKASADVGYRGGEVYECTEEVYARESKDWLSHELVGAASLPYQVYVNASYIDGGLVEEACQASKNNSEKYGLSDEWGVLPKNAILIKDGMSRKGRFVLDLESKKMIKISDDTLAE